MSALPLIVFLSVSVCPKYILIYLFNAFEAHFKLRKQMKSRERVMKSRESKGHKNKFICILKQMK